MDVYCNNTFKSFIMKIVLLISFITLVCIIFEQSKNAVAFYICTTVQIQYDRLNASCVQ
jgi:hypothetical protein